MLVLYANEMSPVIEGEYELRRSNRMPWQWAETLVELRGILADNRGTTK